MSMFIDATGAQHQVPLDVTMYRASADNGQSLRQYINTLYPTREADGTAFEQICASEGIVLRNDPKSGLRASSVREMIQLAFDEVPRIPIAQPTMDVAMQKNVNGYMYWFHLQPDYRQLSKA